MERGGEGEGGTQVARVVIEMLFNFKTFASTDLCFLKDTAVRDAPILLMDDVLFTTSLRG